MVQKDATETTVFEGTVSMGRIYRTECVDVVRRTASWQTVCCVQRPMVRNARLDTGIGCKSVLIQKVIETTPLSIPKNASTMKPATLHIRVAPLTTIPRLFAAHARAILRTKRMFPNTPLTGWRSSLYLDLVVCDETSGSSTTAKRILSMAVDQDAVHNTESTATRRINATVGW